MDNNILDQFSGILQKRKKIRINGKFVIFSFFLALSCFIWYLNKLSGDYVMDIKVPVKVLYTENDKMLVDDEMPLLKLQIKSKGYTLLKYKLSSKFTPLKIDVSSYKLHPYMNETGRYYVLTSQLRNGVASQFPNNVRIENMNPDTLFFVFSKLSTKKVPVVASANLNFRRQYMQVGEIRLNPDSVVISGPESIIKDKVHVKTRIIRGTDLNETLSGTVALQSEQGIAFSVGEVAFSIDVEKYTEGRLSLPIRYNGPDSLGVLLIPSSVDVSYKVAVNDYNKVQPSMFMVVVEPQRNAVLTNNAKVVVTAFPSFISDLKVKPEFVEFYNQKQ